MKRDMHIQQAMDHISYLYNPRKCFWLLGLWMVFGLGTQGIAQQNFPVQIISNLPPPHSPYLSDYQYPQAMTINVILKGQASYSGFLRIKLESLDGRGIVLQTRATYRPVIDLGPSQTFTGAELAPYFSQENLDFIGFDRQQYLRTKRIPDGIYRITYSFYDQFRPDKLVSNTDILSQKVLRVFSISPPLVNLPLQMATTNPSNQSTQPVNINWTRPANTPFNPEYEVILNELAPGCQKAYNGINTGNAAASRISQGELFNCLGPEIYRTTTTALSLNYGMQAEPLLHMGRWYAIRIKASDSQGRTLFINNGVSKIRVFRYGKPCEAPSGLKATSPNPYTAKLTWDLGNNHTGYVVHFRKRPSGEWYRQQAVSNGVEIRDLEPNTRYEFRVSSTCNATDSDLGTGVTHEMPGIPPSKVVCGKPLTVNLSNVTPIETLKAGDKVMAGDFEVLLTEVRPLGGGWFAGKGQTTLNVFQAAKMMVAFQRVKINTDRRLIAGEMAATGGVSVIPDEWRAKYLSFTSEINRVFEEIEKGLSTVGAVMGKIDEALKKIDEWLENYEGEDKEELLETIRIGKKEIEEGKESIKKKKIGEGLKKLKDGVGKVLGVGAKVVKDRLKTLFAVMKDLIKEVIDELSGKSKEEVAKNEKEEKTQTDAMNKAMKETEAQRATMKLANGAGDSTIDNSQISLLPLYEKPMTVDVPKEEWKKRRKNKLFDRWKKAREKLKNALDRVDVERFKFDTLAKMSGRQIIETLKGNIEKDIKELGEGLWNNLMKGDGKEAMKQFIRKFINDKIDERIRVIYKLD